jgi:HSP20 family protein
MIPTPESVLIHRLLNSADQKRRNVTMSMMRWAPFEEMELLKKQIDHLFTTASGTESESMGFSPPVEVLEGEDHYRVRFMLPGLPAENIGEHVNIEATRKTLTVSGESRREEGQSSEKLLITQFRTGRFYKQLSFPDGIDHESIEASYSQGLLELVLPKAAAQEKRNVRITVK